MLASRGPDSVVAVASPLRPLSAGAGFLCPKLAKELVRIGGMDLADGAHDPGWRRMAQ